MIKLRIKNVDMDGYLGRDHHPSLTDIGLVVTVLKIETFVTNVATGDEFDVELDPETNDVRLVRPTGTVVGLPKMEDLFSVGTVELELVLQQLFTVRTKDGRTLELMSHEVEQIYESFVRSVAFETMSSGVDTEDVDQLHILRDRAQRLLKIAQGER